MDERPVDEKARDLMTGEPNDEEQDETKAEEGLEDETRAAEAVEERLGEDAPVEKV